MSNRAMSAKVVADEGQFDASPMKRKSSTKKFLRTMSSINVAKEEKARVEIANLGASILELMEARHRKEKRLIHPNGKFCQIWDPLMFILLSIIAFSTPFEIAFIADTKVDVMFGVNRFFDFLFVCDIFVNFNMMYKDQNGTFVNDRYKIAIRYVKTWFIIDFISILPFDVIGLLSDTTDKSAANLKMVRLVKLLRLLKLLRVLKSSRIIKRWEAQIGLSYAKITVLSFVVILGTTIHWVACIWRLVPTMLHEDDDDNWLKRHRISDSSVNVQYSASAYSAISLLLSGALPSEIEPTSAAEQLATGMMTILTAMLYVFLIGSITSVLESMDQPGKCFRQNMDNLNQFCTERNLSRDLRVRLRGYLRSAQHVYRDRFYSEMLRTLSPMLQGEVTMATHSTWISTLNFLQGVNEDEKLNFSIMLSSILSSRCYAQREYLIRRGELCEKMYVCEKGILARNGSVIGRGGYVGEDVIIHVARLHYR